MGTGGGSEERFFGGQNFKSPLYPTSGLNTRCFSEYGHEERYLKAAWVLPIFNQSGDASKCADWHRLSRCF
jgi:hypothetical protein